MTRNPAAAAIRLALLIDGDNISATYLPLIMREAEKRGTVAVRRIYGQFNSGRMKSWLKQVEEFDLIPVNVSPLTRGKNATDLKLTIEAMDMLTGRQLDGICIASSDGDFTPLAARIRAAALTVFGFGAKKAPQAYKDGFDRFYECDTLLAAEKAAQKEQQKAERKPAAAIAKPATPAAPKLPPAAKQPATAKPANAGASAAKTPVPEITILAAIDAAKGPDSWSHLSTVGKKLRELVPDFAMRHAKSGLKKQIDRMKLVEAKPGDAAFIRRKPG